MSDRGEQLLEALGAHLQGEGPRFGEPLQALAGGFSNEIFRFRLDDAPPPFDEPLVLRLTTDARDTAREAIIQDGVASLGYPAPAVLLQGGPASPFGRPFLVTALAPGVPFDDTITVRTALGALRRVGAQMAGTMADLHGIPTEPIAGRLAAEGWPLEALDSLAVLAEVDEWAASGSSSSDLARWSRVLKENQPSFAPPVVCHGDLHAFNLLFDRGEVVSVLDWELARLADPAYDVGRTLLLLRHAPYPMPRPVRTVVRPVAAWLARRFEEHYLARRPIDRHDLQWHEALHCVRTLAIVRVGATRPPPDRLRRTADVWHPVASSVERRLTELAGRW